MAPAAIIDTALIANVFSSNPGLSLVASSVMARNLWRSLARLGRQIKPQTTGPAPASRRRRSLVAGKRGVSGHRTYAGPHQRVARATADTAQSFGGLRTLRLGTSALLFLQGLGELAKPQEIHNRQNHQSEKDQCRFSHINLLPSKRFGLRTVSGETYKSAPFRPSTLSTVSTGQPRVPSRRIRSDFRGGCPAYATVRPFSRLARAGAVGPSIRDCRRRTYRASYADTNSRRATVS